VLELRQKYPLQSLLKFANLARSSFYWHVQQRKVIDKYAKAKSLLRRLYVKHEGRYGYRRMTLALQKRGYGLNHKTVQRLLAEMGLQSFVRPKRYKSFKGEVGKVAPNILARAFGASRPNEKWVTDVTEFKIGARKLYLSPMMDLFNKEIVAFTLSERPKYQLVGDMLKQAVRKLKSSESPLIHSDQGWQYQMPSYQKVLNERGLIQSMSRKGNCYDNAAMESFFAVLKTELTHRCKFASINQLKTELGSYIRYYNRDRIKTALDGLSPVQYRLRFTNGR
jgi:putative transposase